MIVQASRHYRTLLHLRGQHKVQAGDGGAGGGSNREGKKGASVVVEVPVGTVVWRLVEGQAREFLIDLVQDGDSLIVARGGAGGRGNADFTSPVNREPLLAEAGEEGEESQVVLEVKLVADVGIIGQPSAGKSTLLRAISNARPEVAAYPFTTLEPVLGVVQTRGQQFVMVEIPGLIKGAHEGKGLGLDFLRHAERTRVLLHLVDGAAPDPVAAYRQVNEELACYSAVLTAKPQVVALSKMDLPDVRERAPAVVQALGDGGVEVHGISAATGEGMDLLLGRVLGVLAQPAQAEATRREEVAVVRRKRPAPVPRVYRDGTVIVVSFPTAERLVALADLRKWQVRVQLHRELDRMGVVRALRAFGVKSGDAVRIGSVEMEWV